MKIDIGYVEYDWRCKEGVIRLFQFWPNGVWDENKYVKDEALYRYPQDKYNWINIDEKEEL